MFARIAMNVTAVFIPLYIAAVTAAPASEAEEGEFDTNF